MRRSSCDSARRAGARDRKRFGASQSIGQRPWRPPLPRASTKYKGTRPDELVPCHYPRAPKVRGRWNSAELHGLEGPDGTTLFEVVHRAWQRLRPRERCQPATTATYCSPFFFR